METKIYQGWVFDADKDHPPTGLDYIEPYAGACFLFKERNTRDDERPLAEILEEDITGKNVTVRWWVSNVPRDIEDLKQDWIALSMGYADVTFSAHYSEITGYLWTDEYLKVGGHDLLQEIRSFHGKWMHLEIDIHP